MLSAIGIENFKSYRKARLPLAPLTMLIGANASGKSNAIEALRLLSWIAQGNRLGTIRYQVSEGEQIIRGTTGSLVPTGTNSFSLGAEMPSVDWPVYHIELQVDREDNDLHIKDEKLLSKERTVPLFGVIGRTEGGNDLRVAYDNFARGGKKPQVVCNDQMAVLIQLQSSARFVGSHKKAQRTIPEICTKYQVALSEIRFLDPRPSAMRGYSFAHERRLKEDGSNLSGVLFNLCQIAKKSENILDLVHSLPEQNIENIDFVKTPRGEYMVKLTETFGGQQQEFDATLLSDGTLRVLAIAAAILSAPEGSLVVIEEIDNGVHPSRAELLLNNVFEIARERNLRVLLSSHNPALLDALPVEAVPDVVFCYRDPDDGSSKLTRLEDIPDYPELIAQGTVGHLMTKGIIERFVKEYPGSKARKRKALEWLEHLERQTG